MPTSIAWIVCEESGRWAAALRVELARQAANGADTPRIFEVRSLLELSTALDEHVAALAFVEVHSDNFGHVLELLTKGRWPRARFVALFDRSVVGQSEEESLTQAAWQTVTNALWEAGAAEVIASPRQLHSALKLAELHSATCAKRAVSTPDLAAIAARAWASLPWQDG